MNSVSLLNLNNNIASAKACNHQNRNQVSFTALPKNVSSNQTKNTCNFIKSLYGLFFVPFREKVTAINAGKIQTKSVDKENSTVIHKMYDLWSKKPNSVIKDDYLLKIREYFKMNNDGSFNYKIRDMHIPEYPVSAEYSNQTNQSLRLRGYSGDIKLCYCDKTANISNEERLSLLDSLDKSINAKYDDEIDEIMHNISDKAAKFDDLYTRFHSDPEVIARSILTSPKSIKDEIKIAETSLPYGVELLVEKAGK